MTSVEIPPELRRTKTRLAKLLLPLPEVEGVGIREGHVVVYLRTDAPAVRRRVLEEVAGAAPETEVECVVSGSFAALSRR